MASEMHTVLASIELFEGLEDAELHRIIEVGRVEHWKRGARVLEEGAYGPRMMVVLAGAVEVLRRDAAGVQRGLAALGPGEVLGEMSLLLDLPRTATVRATSALTVFAMDRLAFHEMVHVGDPAILKLGLALSRVLAKRLEALNSGVLHLIAESDELRERFGTVRQGVFKLWEF